MTELTENNFDDFLKNSPKPVVVDFWAAWCGPCQMLGPVIEELSHELKDNFAFVKVDVDKNQALASRFKVSSIPAVHVIKNGQTVANSLGFKPKEIIKQFIVDNA
jgi:thioredoxin 1